MTVPTGDDRRLTGPRFVRVGCVDDGARADGRTLADVRLARLPVLLAVDLGEHGGVGRPPNRGDLDHPWRQIRCRLRPTATGDHQWQADRTQHLLDTFEQALREANVEHNEIDADT